MTFPNSNGGGAANGGTGTFKGLGGQSIQLPISEPKTTETTIPNNGNPAPSNEPVNELIAFNANPNFDKFASTVILEKYGKPDGLFFNKTGDIVNEKNEVLQTKADYEAKATEYKTTQNSLASDYIKELESITLEDGSTGTINEKGEVVVENKVVLTSEQLIDYVRDNVDLSVVSLKGSLPEIISKLSGYEALDEEGKPLSFEDTPEGLAKREKHIVESVANKLAVEKFNSILEEYPGLDDVINHIKVTGSVAGYGIKNTYEGLKIDAKNATQQFNIIVEAEMASGKNLEEATEIANLFKDNDKLVEKSNSALARLQQSEKDAKLLRAKAAADMEIENRREYDNQVALIDKTIKAGKLLTYTIPETIKVTDDNGVIHSVNKSAFVDYVTKPIYNGLTGEQLDASKESIERKLFFAYLRFTKDNLNQLVENKANDKLVEKYRSSQRNLHMGGKNLIIKPSNTNTNSKISTGGLGATSTFEKA